jgi:hypothetical protein
VVLSRSVTLCNPGMAVGMEKTMSSWGPIDPGRAHSAVAVPSNSASDVTDLAHSTHTDHPHLHARTSALRCSARRADRSISVQLSNELRALGPRLAALGDDAGAMGRQYVLCIAATGADALMPLCGRGRIRGSRDSGSVLGWHQPRRSARSWLRGVMSLSPASAAMGART